MRRIKVICAFCMILLSLAACSQGPSAEERAKIDALQAQLTSIRSEISSAESKSSLYSGGLVKSLVEARIEILKTSEALIDQRIQAIEGGSKIEIVVPGIKPDTSLATELESEILSLSVELETSKEDASNYSGGLVGAMKQAAVATQEQSIAMLKQRFYAAKYGLPVAYQMEEIADQGDIPALDSTTQAASEAPTAGISKEIIAVNLLQKRFAEQDYQKYIWLDIDFKAVGLDKNARAIKGVLNLNDLFGETRMSINWTLEEAVSPNGTLVEKGKGFEYNQFIDSHQWVRSTDIGDMTSSFTVTSILYEDGSRQDF